jgi:serine/threonine protein kinase
MPVISGTEDTVLTSSHPPAPATPRLRPGDVVERYSVFGLLGSGGMAEVYRARDTRLGRDVALKLVRPVSEGSTCGMLCSMLMREARTLAALSHPGILMVHDVGEHEGCVYLAMELVDGVTLRDWASGVEDFKERMRVLLDAGRALAAAHAARVVHRDVKPDNILVASSGRVVVSDFGLARSLADVDEGGQACGCAGGATVEIGLDGLVVGTPHYMSLEQHEGRAADSRSDQFGFAVTSWEVIYGSLPFFGDEIDAIREAVRSQRIVPPLEGLSVPAQLSDILRRAMRPEPSARYPNMAALLDRLSVVAVR